jgi:hypothetical protein
MSKLWPFGVTNERLAQLREMAELGRLALATKELSLVFDELIFWREYYVKFEERLTHLETKAGK